MTLMLAHCHGDHLVPGWWGVTHLGSISCLIHIILMTMRPAFIAVFVNQVQQWCACVNVCISVGSLWLFPASFFFVSLREVSSPGHGHILSAELQFFGQPLGVRLDSVLCENMIKDLFVVLFSCFYLNKPNLALLDCQNKDFGTLCWCAVPDSSEGTFTVFVALKQCFKMLALSMNYCFCDSIYPWGYSSEYKGGCNCKCINT